MLTDVFDCHLHTTRSACGEDITDEWLCARAMGNGHWFAVTDHAMHMYYERERAWAMMTEDGIRLFEARRDAGRETILRYMADIRRCGAANMLVGLELDVLPDGQIMFPDDLRDEIDLLVGAIHYLPTVSAKRPQAEVERDFRQQTRWLLEYGVEALAHPFRILLGNGYEASGELVEWVVDLAAQHETPLEINSHKSFPDHDVLMTKLALERGLKLAIGTDAHHSREFGRFGYHEDILREAGVSEKEMCDALLWPGRPSSPEAGRTQSGGEA